MAHDISPPPTKRRKVVLESDLTRTSTTPEPLPTLEINTIRIFSWNVNGITPFLQKSITSFFHGSTSQSKREAMPAVSLRCLLKRHNWPTVLFLQEVKIATKDHKTQDAVRTAVNLQLESELVPNRRGPSYEVHFTLPDDLYNARGPHRKSRVYGVCSIIRTDLHKAYDVNVRTVEWDKEGRVSVVEFVTDTTKLAIFNIYAVNGTYNPYRDPKSGNISGTRHDRKLEFHRLLAQECMNLEERGWLFLLAGDMNVAPDTRDGHPKLRTFPQQHVTNRADFHERLLEGNEGKEGESKRLNGVDVWRKTHGDQRRYTWFSRTKEWGTSCDRVDYVIAGRKLWDRGMIMACGIMDSEAERGPSDHVPIWVDVNLTQPGSEA